MFKSHLKRFLVCLVTASILYTTVFAVPIEKSVKIAFKSIKIFIDGNLVQPKDANGNNIEPFVYNGTTYLPIRSVGEAFDKDVKWDSVTNSVYIESKFYSIQDNEKSSPDVWLNDLSYSKYEKNPVQCTFEKWKDTERDNFENYYNNGFLFSNFKYGTSSNQILDYILSGKYKSIRGKFVLDYTSKNIKNIDTKLRIFGDDKLIYKSSVLKGDLKPVDFNVDIRGVNKLRIAVESEAPVGLESYGSVYFGLVDTGLYE